MTTAPKGPAAMPRPGPRRPALAVRIDADELATLDRQAAAIGITRSELARRILSYALQPPTP